MREQVKIFFVALMFLTRIPCPGAPDYTPERQARSIAYFPVVGVIVGGMGALVYRLVAWGYPLTVAALFGVGATAVVTGAFHEDAFADVCDGFGGWTPDRRLEIMRDSRVGSFGVVGLVLLVGAKVLLLGSLPVARASFALVVGHTVARWSAVLMLRWFPSVTDSSSLARPFAVSGAPAGFVISTLVAALVSLLFGPATAVVTFAAVVLLCLGAGRFFRGWLGGLSGDCLGAVSQVAEVICYMIVIHAPGLEAAARHMALR